MGNKIAVIPLFDESGKVNDVIDISKTLLINDYCYSHDYRVKKVINSIDELKKYFGKLVDLAVYHINYVPKPIETSELMKNKERNSEPQIVDNTLQDDIKELIVNQLVFDVLFDKYLSVQSLSEILRSEYSLYMAEILTAVMLSYKENKIYFSYPFLV